MNQNKLRIGNPTSSEIYLLTTKGKIEMTAEELAARPKTGVGSKTTFREGGFSDSALTYIMECNMERRLGRSISTETNARPLQWGKLVEKHAFDQLGTAYILTSTETDQHPTIPYWAGSKDAHKEDSDGRTVADIKCPQTLKSFCSLVDPLYVAGKDGLAHMDALRNGWSHDGVEYKKHPDGEKYYWQLVSNGIINDCKYGELIVYMPYRKELNTIREMATDHINAHNFTWIALAQDDDLPYLHNGGFYKNINVIRFEIPQADKDFLTDCVEHAGKLLKSY